METIRTLTRIMGNSVALRVITQLDNSHISVKAIATATQQLNFGDSSSVNCETIILAIKSNSYYSITFNVVMKK